MSELHKFLFDGLPVRGVVVRLTDSWTEILRRRAAGAAEAYAQPVREMLGEMVAAATLMQANIKFDGALILQLHGEGPLKLAVVEVQSDLCLRSTAKTMGEVTPGMPFEDMTNQNNLGRCAMTLDPAGRRPGQQPYQGVVSLYDDHKQPLKRFSDVLAHYMLQSEQLDTTLVLAANDKVAAGLLIQRLPVGGIANLGGSKTMAEEDAIGQSEDYNRIAILANSLTADDTFITADNSFVTADGSPVRVPILLNPQGSIGTVRNDNFFAYKFNGLDLDGDQFTYELEFDPGDSTDLPGLTLDPNSGWLYGYIPPLGLTDFTYDFSVIVRKLLSPDVRSDPYDYSLTIIGPIDTDITWLTPADLGTINNGATSTLYVEAINSAGIALQYRLVSGSNSSLPQGLALFSTGEIAGRVSFDTFALDLGATTFDSGPTTFDVKFTFTVNAYSVNGLVSVNRTFSITVIREYNEPYENLYIQAMPPQSDRDVITDLLQNSEIFPTDLIYRPTDPNFGVARNVVYYHAFGLRAATLEDYVESLDINH